MAFELPVVDAASLAAWCEAHLGSPVESELFRTGHLTCVIGTRLADGREVVVRVRPAASRLTACTEVQRRLFDSEQYVGRRTGQQHPAILANSPEAISQMMTASMPPAETHRKAGCRTFGLALYSSEYITLTMITSTGHFAMSQISTAAWPGPKAVPTWFAIGPVPPRSRRRSRA